MLGVHTLCMLSSLQKQERKEKNLLKTTKEFMATLKVQNENIACLH